MHIDLTQSKLLNVNKFNSSRRCKRFTKAESAKEKKIGTTATSQGSCLF